MVTEFRLKKFNDFWKVYVLAHQNKKNRVMHFLATLISIIMGGAFAYTQKFIFLILMPFASYSFAWIGHLMHERNRPLTWTYPVYSLIADYKMFFLMCFGKMEREIVKAQTD